MITVSTFENGEARLATQDRLHAHGAFQLFVRLLAQVVIRIRQVNRTYWGLVYDKLDLRASIGACHFVVRSKSKRIVLTLQTRLGCRP
jgi:hypothetical protein